jgi:hypothetical protein
VRAGVLWLPVGAALGSAVGGLWERLSWGSGLAIRKNNCVLLLPNFNTQHFTLLASGALMRCDINGGSMRCATLVFHNEWQCLKKLALAVVQHT